MKFGKINLFFFLLFILPFSSFAQHEDCDCPEHPGKVNKPIIEQFDLIFKGNVIDIQDCKDEKRIVIFRGSELFKNDLTPKEIPLLIKCNKACSFNFSLNEEWLIYAHEDSTTPYQWTAELCERSRKFPLNSKEDSYTLYNEQTYEEELKHLRKNVHPKPIFIDNKDLDLIQEEELKVIDANRDITIKDVNLKLTLLGISFLCVIIFFFLSKRWFKNK